MQGLSVNLNSIDVGKAQMKVSSALVHGGRGGVPAAGVAAAFGKGGRSNPLEDEVRRDIHRRIECMAKRGGVVEEGAEFKDCEMDALHARSIVQGIDPTAAASGAAGGEWKESREIVPERRHWVASMRGFIFTQHGVAFVHSDGSISLFQHGRSNQCKCGGVHVT